MKLEMIDLEEFTKDLPEVTSPKIWEGKDSNKYAKQGLFSQQLFGPTKSHKCGCPRSIYRGPHSNDKKCVICNVDITTSDERRKRFGKIILPFNVLNPLFYFLFITAKPSLKKVVDGILFYNKKYILLNETGEILPISSFELEDIEQFNDEEKYTKLEGLSGATQYIELICSQSVLSSKPKKELEFIFDNLDKLETNIVIVIPPDFRNVSKASLGSFMTDTINQYYSELLMRINHVKNIPYDISEDQDIFRSYFKSIQTYVFNIHNYIFDKLSTKKGLIRGNILGKRVDFSARAVISPDPTLDLSQCRIPYQVALEILKPQLTAYLVHRKICKRYNVAFDMIDECCKKNDPKLFAVVSDFCKGKYCILNRQPSLHRMSVLAFEMTIHLGNTICIHPMVTNPFGADFDGDAMAIYVVFDKKSILDIEEKLGVWANLLSPADATIVPTPNQDIVLGIYELTR